MIIYGPSKRRASYEKNKPMELKQANNWYANNRERACAQRKDRGIRLREEMFAALGSICACCLEQNKRFLTLDHIQNDGYKERKGKSRGGQPMLLKAKQEGWSKKRFQILCFNCNIGKSLEGGVCPHQQISTVNV